MHTELEKVWAFSQVGIQHAKLPASCDWTFQTETLFSFVAEDSDW